MLMVRAIQAVNWSDRARCNFLETICCLPDRSRQNQPDFGASDAEGTTLLKLYELITRSNALVMSKSVTIICSGDLRNV